MYKLTNITGTIQRVEDGVLFPDDPENCFGYVYRQWIAAGNTPLPADALDPKIAIQDQIDALERQYMLPRITREALLATAITMATSSNVTEAQLYAGNIAYRKMKDFDNQIAQLRAQL